MSPRPAPAVIAFLKTLPIPAIAGRVSTRLFSTLPAVRVALVYDLNADYTYERTPVFQIEVWADDEAVADTIAVQIYDAWPSFRGTFGDAVVSGAWPHSGGPLPLPDPTTNKPRAYFMGALRIHGASS
jgi:hypothetical protein